MPDRAHKETDILLSRLERQLNMIYADAARKIRKHAAPLLDEMYLDDETATQKQRLDFANRHGKAEIVKKVVNILVSANEQAVDVINRRQMGNYKLNFVDACDEVIQQIWDSMDKGGD